jgi:predicted anti-sigma-YlaC factor YlaD
MTEINCESVSMAAMAIADGYESALSADEIKAHIENCSDCRQEITEVQALSSLLDAQKRQQQVANTWTSIEARLPTVPTEQRASTHWRPLMILGVLLLGYRLVEMLPNRDLAWLFKLVPVIFVVAAFMYLRENPFKINAELRFEGE